jgi:hypothetical protein
LESARNGKGLAKAIGIKEKSRELRADFLLQYRERGAFPVPDEQVTTEISHFRQPGAERKQTGTVKC